MSIDDKIATMAKHFGYTSEDVISDNVNRSVSTARNYIFYILHTSCGLSAQEIAQKFNRHRRHIFRQNATTKYQVENFDDCTQIYNTLMQLIA